jgi:signal transduction histidine kinase
MFRQKDDGGFISVGEVSARARVYARGVDHPVNTALGWRLPSWLLVVGPVAVPAVVGAAIELRHHTSASQSLGLALCAAALLWRHRAPLVVLGAELVVMLILNVESIALLPTLLALFTVAEYEDRVRVGGATVLAAASVLATGPLHGVSLGLPAVPPRLVAIALPVAVGLYLRARADYIGGLHERAERLERERELLAHQAAGEERVRIARDLHDVVAHNVALMVVQTQALAATGTRDDEQQAALGRVAGLGREALSEMHRMLGVLRLHDGHGSDRSPQPGVRELEGLVAQTRETGLEVTLAIAGKPRELPPGVELSAYRIVQEALTNVVRHAHAEHAEVELEYSPGQLLVSVADDGQGPQGEGDGGARHGLVGMRERVALFDGELEAGARPDGPGYLIRAALPTG